MVEVHPCSVAVFLLCNVPCTSTRVACRCGAFIAKILTRRGSLAAAPHTVFWNHSLFFAQALTVIHPSLLYWGACFIPRPPATLVVLQLYAVSRASAGNHGSSLVSVCFRASGGVHEPRIARPIKFQSHLLMSL